MGSCVSKNAQDDGPPLQDSIHLTKVKLKNQSSKKKNSTPMDPSLIDPSLTVETHTSSSSE